ncbi:MAG: MurR/RpiR family transcriptional regulator [Planctomycetota bacterium]
MGIQDLIASAHDRLTPTDRRIAEAVLDNPTLLAFGSVSDLAEQIETSRPSIVRFATRLGFDGYTDLQAWAQDQVSRRLSRPSQRIREPDATPLRRSIDEAIDTVFDSLEAERLDAMVGHLVAARHVWVLSGETSMAGAHTLHSGLSMLRANVRLVVEQSVGRDLAGASEDDVAVVFDFVRYRRHSITAARALAHRGVSILAITDGPLSPLAPLADVWCQVTVPAVGPFDSGIPAVVAAELMVSAAARRLGDTARERIDALEALWQSTGTFLEDAGP